MEYSHTQRSPLGVTLLAGGSGTEILGIALLVRGEMIGIVLCLIGFLVVSLALCFWWLKIEDQGETLRVQYGPLPIFGTSIRYESMMDVTAGQTSLIDGWGIHYIPMRGWTYNLWGWHCAIITLKNSTVRLGTDDVEGLVEFLNSKLNDTPFDVDANQER